MSNILTEDIVKSSYNQNEQLQNKIASHDFFLTEADFNVLFDARYEENITGFHAANILDLLNRINDLEKKIVEQDETISEMQEMFMELSENQNKGYLQDDSRLSESRANLVYPEVCKKGKLTTSDIKRICKIKHYSAVYRVCEKVVEMHPDECVYDKGISGTGRKYLALKDYRGF